MCRIVLDSSISVARSEFRRVSRLSQVGTLVKASSSTIGRGERRRSGRGDVSSGSFVEEGTSLVVETLVETLVGRFGGLKRLARKPR